jgi:formylglycine-generating enzyme required for sulfatase activity
MLPTSSLKPNDLGLFDMLGNAWEWCQDAHTSYLSGSGPGAREDVEAGTEVSDDLIRIQRGGALNMQGLNVRAARRFGNLPRAQNGTTGFRVAKTIR